MGGMQDMAGDALREPGSALILGEITNAQRRSAQYVAINHASDAAEADWFLTALGLRDRYPDES